MKIKRNRARIQLLNGCSCSQFSVHPANWEDKGAKVTSDWYIFYRFYDPTFKDDSKYKNGKLCLAKGMNEFKTLTERRNMTRGLLEREKDVIINQGLNPITKQYMKPYEDPNANLEIPSDTPLTSALLKALEKKKCSPELKIDLRSVLKYFTMAAKQLRYDQIPVDKVKRSHVMNILQQCGEIKRDKWTPNNYNFYRAHLMILFEVLVLWCTIDFNPVEKIPVEQVVRERRKILTPQQRTAIDKHLRQVNFPLWLVVQIFFLSGCRRAELLRVQGKKVDLHNQRFSVLRKKGRKYTYVDYTIPDNAVHLWKMAMVGCGPEDFVFSVGLKPGPASIRPEQVTRRWKRWVKNAVDENKKKLFGDDVPDFYSLKHLQTTEISKKHGTKVAADFNNESEAMIIKHYDVGHEDRKHEKNKGKNQSFAQ